MNQLIKGGQGRSDEEMGESATVLFIVIAILCVIFIVLFIFDMVLKIVSFFQ